MILHLVLWSCFEVSLKGEFTIEVWLFKCGLEAQKQVVYILKDQVKELKPKALKSFELQ